MGYLLCDKCQGYYKLKTEESPNDFIDKCECGGNLRYSTEIEEDIIPNLEEDNTTDIVEDSLIDMDGDNYPDIDEELSSIYIEDKVNKNAYFKEKNITNIEGKKKYPYLDKYPNVDFRLTRLILGVLIVLVPSFLYNNFTKDPFFAFSLIPLLMGGFISSFFSKGKIKDGILNGTRVGIFSGIIALLIFIFFNTNFIGFSSNSNPDTGLFMVSFMLLILFTSIGGLMGIVTRDLFLNKQKTVEPVIETPIIIEDSAETKYHDEMVKLGYKQIKAIKDGEQVFKSLLKRSITEKEAIERLNNDKNVLSGVLAEMEDIDPPEKYREYHSIKRAAIQDICKTFQNIDGLVYHDPQKIGQTNNLVESSTTKINQAIEEIQKTLQEYYDIDDV